MKQNKIELLKELFTLSIESPEQIVKSKYENILREFDSENLNIDDIADILTWLKINNVDIEILMEDIQETDNEKIKRIA